ncbi:hypothetical protein ABK905_03475 [Acerihabitans sp. KWT182]|uniref:Uncharacterized protein n=1 Tax=Acerihabitans sp. KWT182 TaxID=3157919 RepID=A0AAU7QBM4_9GAMM
MNIVKAMEQFKGPKAVIPPHEGTRFVYGQEQVSAQLKLALNEYPHYKFSVVRFDLRPGQSLDLMASMLFGRMLYCLEGKGVVVLNAEVKPFFRGSFRSRRRRASCAAV